MKHNTNTTTTTTTTSGKAAARMDTAAVIETAAALLKKHKTTAAVDEHRAEFRAKYGAENWKAIRAEISDIRRKEIENTAAAVRRDVFGYSAVLGAQFAALQRNKDWKTLCNYARATYKGTDTDTARALVRDWFTNVDTATGAPLVLVRYLHESARLIFAAYQPAKLDGRAALVALQTALNNMKAAAVRAARKRADTAAATIDNKRTAGAIVAVWDTAAGKDNTITTGAALSGKNAATGKEYAAALKAAAALIGRPVPSAAVTLSEYNAAARAATLDAARAALVEKIAAVTTDAARAGVNTTAPAKRTRKADKATATA